MDKYVEDCCSYLEKLVGFETISGRTNLEFIEYIRALLAGQGVEAFISYDETGQRANLHAFVGPAVDGGVVLNGHTDVVPVEGQKWTNPPFELTERNGKLYGRGSVDMKGYLACMLAAVPMWQQKDLKKPIHISVCYDEETGGFGAPVLVADMGETAPRPAVAIVGEPTEMQMVTAHKGAVEMRTVITGFETHACDPRKGVNAVVYAARFITRLDEMARRLAANPDHDSVFDPPYATVNVGAVNGGTAGNIVAGQCSFIWEIRPIQPNQGEALVAEMTQYAMEELLPEMRQSSPEANFEIMMEANVPGLGHKQAERAVELVAGITGLNSTSAVAFGTDAGHFAKDEISTLVMGPGSIDRAHKGDEYIKISELEDCLTFFDNLGDELAR